MLYTILGRSGEILVQHVTLVEAAEMMIIYDGGMYEIRRGEDCYDVGNEAQWHLFSKKLGGDWVRTKSIKAIYAINAEMAWPMIAVEIIRNRNLWDGPKVMADNDYDDMINNLG